MQTVTLCISTTMVLILLGLVVLSVQTAHNMSDYIREHLTVTVVLSDTVSEQSGRAICAALAKKDYVAGAEYISKEQALEEQTEAMGTDPSEFLGTNPFVATIEIRMKADYANSDSLKMVAARLRQDKGQISEVSYQEDLTARVNHNLQQALLVLLVLAALLIFVSYALIANSVRLGVYSERFAIHTMKLVGASWSFVRRPFLMRAIRIGLASSLLACVVLEAVCYGLFRSQPGIEEVVGITELAVTAVAIVAFGFVIMTICTLLSVNKFLRMTAGEVYKI